MIDTRLALAVAARAFDPPDAGAIAVLHPPADATLEALPKDQVVVVERFKPLHDAWRARGFRCVVEPEDGYSAVIISLPRAKAQARAEVAAACAMTSGPVVIDGQKTDGVDSLLRDMRKITSVSAPISKAHGKLFVCPAPEAEDFSQWSAGPALTPGGFWTAPGVFSADAIDPASALLAEALPDDLGSKVADLGAGWGFLSAHVLTREKVASVHLVEADHMALECARRNVPDPRTQFHWADATVWQTPDRIDTVVMNPPFHASRAADPALGQAFVSAAARLLSPKGELWMVANRHLPYEQCLQSCFAKTFELGGDTRFKLFRASRPKRPSHR